MNLAINQSLVEMGSSVVRFLDVLMIGKSRVVLVVLLMLCSMVPFNVSAADSGGILASSDTMSYSPLNPSAGDSIEITLTLSNNNQATAYDVQYSFYKDSISSGSRIKTDLVTISGQGFEDVTATWNSLTAGEHRIWVTYEYNGAGEQSFFLTFNVTGLADIRIDSASITQPSVLNSGDTAQLEIVVSNAGTVDAPESKVGLNWGDGVLETVPTPALTAGQSATLYHNFTLPQTGEHTLQITPDSEDDVTEANEQGKELNHPYTVSPRVDIEHHAEISISTEDEFNGPWIISGTISKDRLGSLTVPVYIEIIGSNGNPIPLAPIQVELAGEGFVTEEWSYTLTSGDVATLAKTPHTVTAVIDRLGTWGVTQENISNDRSSSTIVLEEVPDVYVDAIAIPDPYSVNSGDMVTWSVTATNTASVEVTGTFSYTWEGSTGESILIRLNGGEAYTWVTEPLPTLTGAHTAYFNAQWIPSAQSYDSDPTNSQANGTVSVEAPLRLNWVPTTLAITDSSGENAPEILENGEEYTISINLTSIETGELTFFCTDNGGNLFQEIPVNVEERGQRVNVQCTFVASGPLTTVMIQPSDSNVVNTYSRAIETSVPNNGNGDPDAQPIRGFILIGGVSLFVLIGILVAAIYLTREVEEEVERDIYEYCPSCDHELEGHEDRCPSCNFNLKKARKQFHDCHACGQSIPDLMEYCVYCGAEQDVKSFFEQRERKEVVKKEIAIKEISDDEIVSGTADFAATVKEFGHDEDDLESEWDENIAVAEEAVDQAWERRNANDIALEEMTPEEYEDYQNQITTKMQTASERFASHDIDKILAEKGDIEALKDDGSELSASDAKIRERLFEITGEDGVLPGEEVKVGMSLTDSSLAGNEIKESSSDFSFDDDEFLNETQKAEKRKTEERKKRRAPRKRTQVVEEKPETAECGACGSDIPVNAKSCNVCGAVFE